MLLSNRIDVLLRPDEVRIARRRSIRRFQVTRDEANGIDLWQASVDRLSVALLEMGVRAGALHVVLSDHFLRYLLVPWSDKLVADKERLAYARLMLQEVYGAMAEGWDVCMDDQPAGQPSFACAVDGGLVHALRERCQQRGLRVAALVPALAARINRHRRALKAAAFCLASVEPGRLTLAFRASAGWTAVRSRRNDAPLAEALPAAMKQESAASGSTSAGTLYLVGEDIGQLPLFAIPGWQVARLSEEAPPPSLSPTLAHAVGAG